MKERFTEEEINCLLLAAQGVSIECTADRLKIAVPQVRRYHRNIIKKLGCSTVGYAVFYAVSEGIIPSIIERNSS